MGWPSDIPDFPAKTEHGNALISFGRIVIKTMEIYESGFISSVVAPDSVLSQFFTLAASFATNLHAAGHPSSFHDPGIGIGLIISGPARLSVPQFNSCSKI